jgi:hypothetical protein
MPEEDLYRVIQITQVIVPVVKIVKIVKIMKIEEGGDVPVPIIIEEAAEEID